MQKAQKALFWTIVLSEGTHVFCCVLPTLVSAISLIMGVGALAILPGFLFDVHQILHTYEVPTIIFSGVTLALGWGLHAYSRHIDCRTDACCAHESCAPKKNNTFRIMVAASVLFVFNVLVFFVFHYGKTNF